jgi:Tol biopolymer transport system component/DNA-binding winged helix-turn-helix (wHTH) protein
MIRPANHSYQFGHFRLEPDARLLLHDGQPVTLTPKAFDTLLALVRQPGRVLTREELMQEVWPDTFVEEANLTVNISTLRKALGEHPTQHRYIVTVPGRGYRFVAEVKEMWEEGTSGVVREQAAEKKLEEVETARATQAEPSVAPRRSRAKHLLWALPLIAVVLLIVWRSNISLTQPAAPLRIVPITSFPGQKSQPTFSPDGNQVAFVWDGGNGGNQDIYVKLIDAGTPLRLTSDAAAESDPVWSADGKHLAFLRPMGGRNAIFLIPALGGSERKVAEVAPSGLWQNLDWSADGKYLAVSDRGAANEAQGIFLIAVESGEKRRLTTPPQSLSDGMPKFSPDGKTLAFVRGSSIFVNDLYLVPVAGGEARRLTTDQRWLFGQAWTADSRALIFSSNRGGLFSLWRIPTAGGAVEALPAAGEDALYPAISRQGNRLSYVRWKIDSNIWRVAGPNATASEAAAPPVKLIASTREDAEPQISPDGKRIAFHSNRTGSYEIWVCASDGKNPIQLTHFKGPQGGSPRWSPDGRQIVFDCRLEGPSDIFVINVDGGAPRRLTTEASEDVVPSWSRDGRWVYFASNRSGTQQVWKIPAEGGTAQQVTQQGGFEPFESTDGRVLYYHKRGSIWRVPVGGGEEARVLDQVEWGYWAVTEQGICFLNRQAQPRPAIELFNFATGQVKRITMVEQDLGVPPPGFAVSPDGRWIFYKRVDQSDNDIMLVENFR